MSHTPPPPHHRREQPQIVQPLLGMPLHRQNEVLAGDFDRLDDPVGVLRADDQAVAELVDGLVVVALGVRRFADQRGQPGAGHGAHRRRREHRVALLVVGVADHIGQMLVQACRRARR